MPLPPVAVTTLYCRKDGSNCVTASDCHKQQNVQPPSMMWYLIGDGALESSSCHGGEFPRDAEDGQGAHPEDGHFHN